MPLKPTRRYNPDQDGRYRRPRAWARTKADLGGSDGIAELMKMVESYVNPRVALAVALHHFATTDTDTLAAMNFAYCKWMDERPKISKRVVRTRPRGRVSRPA